MPLAYFITFSTYGTWLHGTDKGAGSVDRKHNVYGAEFVAPDAERLAREREAMTQPPYALDAPRRVVVCEAIVGLCREKAWSLLALHVRSNHVHVVVAAEREPGRLMSDLKARASRELTRAGFDTAERTRWTRHGSTLHLFEPSVVEAKIDYTLCRQGERMAWFDGSREHGVSGHRDEPRTE
jgi:hypothetical protein